MALFDQLVDRVSAALWNLHPAGRPCGSASTSTTARCPTCRPRPWPPAYDRLGRLRGQVAALTGLAPDQELDRAVLLAALDAEVLAGEVADGWRRDPGRYLEALAVEAYLGRDYAPAGLRLEKAATVLQSAPEVLAAARANLRPVIPRPAAERGAEQARGAGGPAGRRRRPSWAAPPAGPRSSGCRRRPMRLPPQLEGLRRTGWRRSGSPSPTRGSRSGRRRVEQMLRAGEMLGRSLDEAAGLAAVGPGGRPSGPRRGGAGRPGRGEAAGTPPDGRVDAVRAAVEEARRFAAGAGLATIPDAGAAGGGRVARCVLAGGSSPRGRTTTRRRGRCCAPERRRAGGGRAPSTTWPWQPPTRDDCCRHSGRRRPPPRRRRRFSSRAFEEGWALYAGESMWEAGYRAAGPAWRRAWLRRALRADCRLVCVPALHRGEMSLEQAEVLFMEQGRCERAAARREAGRAAVDPGCLSAALGRLEILDLRRRWQGRFPGAPVGAFHDVLLSRGGPAPRPARAGGAAVTALPAAYLEQFSEPPGYLEFASTGPVPRRVREAVAGALEAVAAPRASAWEAVADSYDGRPGRHGPAAGGAAPTRSPRSPRPRPASSRWPSACSGTGGNVVVPAHEFPANVYPWLRAAEAGGPEVRLVACPDGRVTAGAARRRRGRRHAGGGGEPGGLRHRLPRRRGRAAGRLRPGRCWWSMPSRAWERWRPAWSRPTCWWPGGRSGCGPAGAAG